MTAPSNEIKFKTVKVSAKGRIALPSDIQKEMGLKKGDDIVLMKKGKHILIEKADTLAKMQDEFEDLQEFSEESLKRLWSNKEDEIWDRYYHMNLPDLTSERMPVSHT